MSVALYVALIAVTYDKEIDNIFYTTSVYPFMEAKRGQESYIKAKAAAGFKYDRSAFQEGGKFYKAPKKVTV